MAIDKPIGFIPEQEEAIEQLTDMQIDESVEQGNVEMMEDGSAIIGEQVDEIQTSFDKHIQSNIFRFN